MYAEPRARSYPRVARTHSLLGARTSGNSITILQTWRLRHREVGLRCKDGPVRRFPKRQMSRVYPDILIINLYLPERLLITNIYPHLVWDCFFALNELLSHSTATKTGAHLLSCSYNLYLILLILFILLI